MRAIAQEPTTNILGWYAFNSCGGRVGEEVHSNPNWWSFGEAADTLVQLLCRIVSMPRTEQDSLWNNSQVITETPYKRWGLCPANECVYKWVKQTPNYDHCSCSHGSKSSLSKPIRTSKLQICSLWCTVCSYSEPFIVALIHSMTCDSPVSSDGFPRIPQASLLAAIPTCTSMDALIPCLSTGPPSSPT